MLQQPKQKAAIEDNEAQEFLDEPSIVQFKQQLDERPIEVFQRLIDELSELEPYDKKSESKDKRTPYQFKTAPGFITVPSNGIPTTSSERTDRSRVILTQIYIDEELIITDDRLRQPHQATCPAHGGRVEPSTFQSDHIYPKSLILKKLKFMEEWLNSPDASDIDKHNVQALKGRGNYFVFRDGKYHATKYGAKQSVNLSKNLWLICQPCNLNKKDIEPLEWFRSNPLYGQEFCDYLIENGYGADDSGSLFLSDEGEHHLNSLAYQWFLARHDVLVELGNFTSRNMTNRIQAMIELMDSHESTYKAESDISLRSLLEHAVQACDSILTFTEQAIDCKLNTTRMMGFELTPSELQRVNIELARRIPKLLEQVVQEQIEQRPSQMSIEYTTPSPSSSM